MNLTGIPCQSNWARQFNNNAATVPSALVPSTNQFASPSAIDTGSSP